MDSFLCHKDIHQILPFVSNQLHISSEDLRNAWNIGVKEYLESFGITIGSGDTEENSKHNDKQCQHPCCTKNVVKSSQYIDGKLYCSLHFKHMLKKAKRSSYEKCQHIFSPLSKFHGQTCTGHAIPGALYCSKHKIS